MKVLLVPALLLVIVLSLGLGGYNLYHWAWGAETRLRAARRALEEGGFARAETELGLYLKDRPHSAEAHLLAAQAARRALEPSFPAAQDPFRRSPQAEGNPDVAAAFEGHLRDCERFGGIPQLVRLERFLFRAQCGDLAEVEGDLQAVARPDSPFTPLILEALAKGYILTYRLTEAEAYLRRKLEHREDARTLVWRGRVRRALGNQESALADFRRAVELAPENETARLALAEALLSATQPGEAVGHFAFLGQRFPDNPDVVVGLARCRRSLGDASEARRLLDAFLAGHPRQLKALVERGKLALDEGLPAEAETWLRQAVDVAPNDYQATYILSQCLLQRGRAEEGRTLLARADRVKADLHRLDEVVRQVMHNPRSPDPRSEAGQIFLRNGQVAEGLRWLESALQLDPRHAPTHQALAEHYAKVGDADRAAQHRRLALAPHGKG